MVGFHHFCWWIPSLRDFCQEAPVVWEGRGEQSSPLNQKETPKPKVPTVTWDLNGCEFYWRTVTHCDTGTKISKSMIIRKSYSIFCELLWAHGKFYRQSPFGSVWWVYGLLASDAHPNGEVVQSRIRLRLRSNLASTRRPKQLVLHGGNPTFSSMDLVGL